MARRYVASSTERLIESERVTRENRALAGVVSLLYVSKTGVLDFQMGVPLAIAGFVGTVVGGMGSLPGAVLGGFALGVASTLLQALLPEALQPSRDAFLYGLVIIGPILPSAGPICAASGGRANLIPQTIRPFFPALGLIAILVAICAVVHLSGNGELQGY